MDEVGRWRDHLDWGVLSFTSTLVHSSDSGHLSEARVGARVASWLWSSP